MDFATILFLLNESYEMYGRLLDGLMQDRFNPDRYLVLADFVEESGDSDVSEMLRIAVEVHKMHDSRDRQEILQRYWKLQRKVGSEMNKKNVNASYDELTWRGRNGQWNQVWLRSDHLLNSGSGPMSAVQLPSQAQRGLAYMMANSAFASMPFEGQQDGDFTTRLWKDRVFSTLMDLANLFSTNTGYADTLDPIRPEEMDRVLTELETLARNRRPVAPDVQRVMNRYCREVAESVRRHTLPASIRQRIDRVLSYYQR